MRCTLVLVLVTAALSGCGLAGTGAAGAAGAASEVQEAAQARQTEQHIKQQIDAANQQAEANRRAAEHSAESQSQ